MESCRIYLSGAMSGLSFEEQSKWRKQVMNAIKFEDHDYVKSVSFFDPTQYYGFEESYHKSEREIMEYELYNLRKSDLVIVNFNNPNSIGTAMELAIAKELRIPIIAFGVNGQNIHPWLLETCTRVCDNMREAVEHTVNYFLN